VVRSYLIELEHMAREQSIASVITHLDYAIRSWPESSAGPFDPVRCEDEIRAAMTAIADAGLALEMNTRRLQPWVAQWWAECGGQLITFGSDAHVPEALARGFEDAAELLEELGFAPGDESSQPWVRS
jgi:histidinol-phosphatase (PHP family)